MTRAGGVGRAFATAALALALAGCAASPRRRAQAPPPPLAKAVVRTARSYLPEEDKGRPTPIDCSDFVGRVFREHGIRLPRSSPAMALKGAAVASADLRMGDLVFFSGSGGGRGVGHVGVYVHNGVFIHQANPGEGVRMESLYSDHYRRRYLKARRVITP
ncbi:MAG: C40 family peptidase [Elusimicrobia bacterium]|nr:C40 family peptidase [Elusimicrobiota bacterium]